jgi:hypothetical protein
VAVSAVVVGLKAVLYPAASGAENAIATSCALTLEPEVVEEI